MRIKSLDLLKAIAILGIVFYHLDILLGGYIGVDAFFLISGFLIMLSVRRNYTNNFSVFKSMNSRLKQICIGLLPGIYLLVLLGMIYYRININFSFEVYNNQGISALFGVSNWFNILNSVNYWGGSPSIFTHLWFSSVLIQFYLIFSILTIGFVKILKNNKKGLIIIFSFILVIAFCWLLLIKPEINEFNRIYYGTDTRVIPFILGILIELVLVNDENQLIELSESLKSKIKYPLILFLLVLGALFYVLSFNVMNIKYIIIISSILFAIITIFFLLLNFNRENRFLNILYFIGENSLVVYLFHWPVIVILKEYGSTNIVRTIFFIILISLIGYIILIKYNIFKKYNLIKLVAILIVCISMNNYWIPKWANRVSSKPVLSENKDSDIRLLVIGDSYGRVIGNSLNNIAEKEKISVLNESISSFGIMKPEYYISFDGSKRKPNDVYYNYLEEWKKSIEKFNPNYVAIVLGTYDQSLQVIDGKELRVGDNQFDKLYKEHLIEIIEFFLENNIRVVLTNITDNGRDIYDKRESEYLNTFSDAMRKNIIEVSKQFNSNDVIYFDIDKLLSPESKINVTKDNEGKVIFDETDHPTEIVCDYIAESIIKEIRK